MGFGIIKLYVGKTNLFNHGCEKGGGGFYITGTTPSCSYAMVRLSGGVWCQVQKWWGNLTGSPPTHHRHYVMSPPPITNSHSPHATTHPTSSTLLRTLHTPHAHLLRVFTFMWLFLRSILLECNLTLHPYLILLLIPFSPICFWYHSSFPGSPPAPNSLCFPKSFLSLTPLCCLPNPPATLSNSSFPLFNFPSPLTTPFLLSHSYFTFI